MLMENAFITLTVFFDLNWLSKFTFIFHFHALEKEMATHSSVLAWRIPGTGEPGGLPSMGWHRVGHDWSDLAAAAVLILMGGSFGREAQLEAYTSNLNYFSIKVLNVTDMNKF